MIDRWLMLQSMKRKHMQCSRGGTMSVSYLLIPRKDERMIDHFVCDDCSRWDEMEVK